MSKHEIEKFFMEVISTSLGLNNASKCLENDGKVLRKGQVKFEKLFEFIRNILCVSYFLCI